ncbi:MAG: HAD family phosphatase [Acidobacteriota bacterium]
MLRAILFDFNGVIVDDEPLHFGLFQEVLDECGIALTEEAYYREYVGYDDRECFRAVFRAAGRPLDDATLTSLIDDKARRYQAWIFAEGYPIYPGAEDLIRDVAAIGFQLGVVSGALRAEVEGALAQLEVRRFFTTIVAADDVTTSKPDPAGYLRGYDELAAANLTTPPLLPREVLAIEDTPAGLAAATAADLRTLAVTQTHKAEQLAVAEHVVPTVADISVTLLREMFDA